MLTDRSRRTVFAVGIALLVSGCEHSTLERPDAAQFGEPNRQTMAAQVIDPDPQYGEPLATSGDTAAQAAERRRTDKVKKPERQRTTQSAAGN